MAPIALHPENGHYFLFRGRPTVLISSAEHYGALLNLEFDFVSYLKELEARGAYVIRSAGSKGVADLCVLWPGTFNRKPELVQVKRGKGRATADERIQLEALARRFGCQAQIVTVRPRQPDHWECLV